MKKMNFLDWAVVVLLIIGGLNWGLVGFFGFDLVSALFGQGVLSARLIYAIVGIASIYAIIMPTIFGREECLSGDTIRTSA